MGIGAIIGTGIFVLTGVASATRAGPSLTLSFVVAGLVSALAALCYAEVSSKIPISGSAYTYTYATLGEFLAWIIGWDLVLEYALGAATVSIGWSGYFVNIMHQVSSAPGLGWLNIPRNGRTDHTGAWRAKRAFRDTRTFPPRSSSSSSLRCSCAEPKNPVPSMP